LTTSPYCLYTMHKEEIFLHYIGTCFLVLLY
jgi:hypothetical protein